MPLLMIIAEWKWLRTKDEIYLTLAKRWAKGTAILFAVGAVSGTVLSFELGLLWPGFMGYAGSIIGMPFSLEGSNIRSDVTLRDFRNYRFRDCEAQKAKSAEVLCAFGASL